MVIDAVRSKSVGAIYTRLERGKMPRRHALEVQAARKRYYPVDVNDRSR
jgi:hypothetical protein